MKAIVIFLVPQELVTEFLAQNNVSLLFAAETTLHAELRLAVDLQGFQMTVATAVSDKQNVVGVLSFSQARTGVGERLLAYPVESARAMSQEAGFEFQVIDPEKPLAESCNALARKMRLQLYADWA